MKMMNDSPPSGQPSMPEGARPTVSRLDAFAQGFRAPWEGFCYMRRNPGLWRYAIIPMALTLLLTLITLGVLVAAAAWFVTVVSPSFPEGWYWLILEIACGIVVLVLALLAAMVAYLLLNAIVCEYYRGKLAEIVEQQLGLRPEDIHEMRLMYHVVDAVRDVGFLAAANVALLLLHVIPVAGSIAAVAGSLYFECITFGADYLDYPVAASCRSFNLLGYYGDITGRTG